MEKTRSVVVSDAGPLIHMDELKIQEIWAQFSQVLVPTEVIKEVVKYRGADWKEKIPNLKVVYNLPLDPTVTNLSKVFSLHKGEQYALSLMLEHQHAIFLTDDSAARLASNQLGFKVHGSIGIIIRSLRAGLKTKVEIIEILEAIPENSSLFIKKVLLDKIILDLKEGL